MTWKGRIFLENEAAARSVGKASEKGLVTLLDRRVASPLPQRVHGSSGKSGKVGDDDIHP